MELLQFGDLDPIFSYVCQNILICIESNGLLDAIKDITIGHNEELVTLTKLSQLISFWPIAVRLPRHSY